MLSGTEDTVRAYEPQTIVLKKMIDLGGIIIYLLKPIPILESEREK